MTVRQVLKSAFAFLFEMEEQMNQICDQMASAPEDQMESMMEELGTLQDLLMAHDFYVIDAKVEEVARAIPSIGFEAYHHDDVYTYQPNAVTRHHLGRAGLPSTEAPIADMPLPWSKAILQQRSEVLLETQRYMLERWSEHYEVIFSNPVLLELTRKGSSKGGMVELLARRLGIRPGHIYCIGDNQNDIPMLAVSAIPFAPSNCAPEVRAWGARILGSCEESCVAQAIRILYELY